MQSSTLPIDLEDEEAEQQPNHLYDLEEKEKEFYEDEDFDFVEALSSKNSSTLIPYLSK